MSGGASTELISAVQSWIDSSATNFGFMLVSQSESSQGSARRFASREQPGGLIPAPQLIVTYSVVPEPPVFGLAAVGLIGFVFARRR